MIQVLRFSGLAIVASVVLALAIVFGFFVISFFVREWHPDWSIAWSVSEGLQVDLGLARPPDAPDVSPWDRLWPWGAAALAPLVWYLGAWWVWGRDRRLGVEFPRFRPPEGLSPAGVRQILDMGFDAKCMAAEMLSLAVRGHLRIEREPVGVYRLRRTDSPSSELTVAERHLLATLFRARSHTRLHYSDAAHLRVAMEVFREKLEHELEGPVYETNIWAVALGLVISGISFMAATARLPDVFPGSVDFWLAGGTLIAMAAVNVLFFRLMKAPTELGREILDAIGGFRRYLATAEHERMKLADAPRLTAHLFARYLPYALAMDIELDWAERFAGTVQRAIPDALDFEWYADPNKVIYDMGLMGMVHALGGATAAAFKKGEGD
jgi:hypothetical protein